MKEMFTRMLLDSFGVLAGICSPAFSFCLVAKHVLVDAKELAKKKKKKRNTDKFSAKHC